MKATLVDPIWAGTFGELIYMLLKSFSASEGLLLETSDCEKLFDVAILSFAA